MKIAVLIPAYNEEANIEECVKQLLLQTRLPDKIIVVDNESRDKTPKILEKLKEELKELLIVLFKAQDGSLKSGAINEGLKYVYKNNFELVVIIDADARLNKDLIKNAIQIFKKDKKEEIGGICSVVSLRGKGLLYRLQKLEYGSFNAERTGTWRNIMILHGLCGAYRTKALKEVNGFSEGHALEDYDITLKLKKAGYKVVFSKKLRAEAEAVKTLKRLIRQRLRWYVWGIKVLKDYGINKFTLEDFVSHIMFIAQFILIWLIIGMSVKVYAKWQPMINFHPIPIILAVIGITDGLYRLKFVEKRDKIDILIRIALIPEIIYSTFLSFIKFFAYILAFAGKYPKW